MLTFVFVCAFQRVGCDFVGWLAEYLQTDDRAEVLHLGSFFCHLGYIYPVFDMKTSLKDDSTLYRFQVSIYKIGYTLCSTVASEIFGSLYIEYN